MKKLVIANQKGATASVFAKTLVRCAAPALCGIKAGNLFSVRQSDFCESEFFDCAAALESFGIQSAFVQGRRQRIVAIFYDADWVQKILSNPCAKKYLLQKGYSNCGPCDAISVQDFVKKVCSKIKSGSSFPHEVGLLLGYPLLDVIDFERRGGRGCVHCGSWKAYRDVESAKKLSLLYKECSKRCLRLFERGFSIKEIICYGKKAVKAA